MCLVGLNVKLFIVFLLRLENILLFTTSERAGSSIL